MESTSYVPEPADISEEGSQGSEDTSSLITGYFQTDQAVMTPKGPVRIGELIVGDEVFGTPGAPIRVTGVVHREFRDICQITTCDGVEAVVDSDHLWQVITFSPQTADRHNFLGEMSVGTLPAAVRGAQPTRKLRELIDEDALVYIPLMTSPARFAEEDVYPTLGDYILEIAGHPHNHPNAPVYDIRRSSVVTRYRFLKTLLSSESEGFVRVGNRELAEMIAYVARSLGGTAELRQGRSRSTEYVVRVRLPKSSPGEPRLMRRIVAIHDAGSGTVVGISVDSPDGMYTTDGFLLVSGTTMQGVPCRG